MVAAFEDEPGAAPTPSGSGWTVKLAFAAAIALVAGLLVVSAQADGPVEASRTGRRVELVELINAEQRRTKELEAEVAELSERVAKFENREAEGAQRFARLQARIDRVMAPAGLTAVRGPGVTAVLTDSTLPTSPTGNLNDLVIHEQDLQAVINALWAGGAEAMSVNGQRILATTAIRCVGNTLLLHGAVYSPPYVIRGVGDAVALRTELNRDRAVAQFRAAAREFKLGFAVTDEMLEIPAFEGPTGVTVAQIAEGSAP